jgi:hypothetical protein
MPGHVFSIRFNQMMCSLPQSQAPSQAGSNTRQALLEMSAAWVKRPQQLFRCFGKARRRRRRAFRKSIACGKPLDRQQAHSDTDEPDSNSGLRVLPLTEAVPKQAVPERSALLRSLTGVTAESITAGRLRNSTDKHHATSPTSPNGSKPSSASQLRPRCQ